jgi:hypothetical protein
VTFGRQRKVHWKAIDVYRITEERINEEWAADDIATVLAPPRRSAHTVGG